MPGFFLKVFRCYITITPLLLNEATMCGFVVIESIDHL